jgi:hypothetical protein
MLYSRGQNAMRTPSRWPGAIRGGQHTVIALPDVQYVEDHEFAPQRDPEEPYLDEGFYEESYASLSREYYVRREE